jgi:hypothetical protein
VPALGAKGLRTIVFANSTNRDVEGPWADDWGEVERIVLDELDSWHEAEWSPTDVRPDTRWSNYGQDSLTARDVYDPTRFRPNAAAKPFADS